MTGAVDSATLWLFAIAVLVLLASPGPNMAFILPHGMAFGPSGGVAAAAGICCTDLLMTLLTVLGVTAAVAAWPPSFDILRCAGTAYLLYIAFKTVKPTHESSGSVRPPEGSVLQVFVKAIGGSLINPKPMLFFMVFLPQFVNPQRGSTTSQIASQLLVLGSTLAVIAFVFHAMLSLCAGYLGRTTQSFLQHYPQVATLQRWGLAIAMTALAAYLFFAERPIKGKP